jgi:hypothetical protein
MKIIKLDQENDHTVWVNPACIERFWQDGDGTTIRFTGASTTCCFAGLDAKYLAAVLEEV